MELEQEQPTKPKVLEDEAMVVATEDEDVVVEDEMESEYHQIESSVDVNQFLKLLRNERSDDIAVKVKEKCIYKYACSMLHYSYLIIDFILCCV